jgi:Pentapeptide repeats (8 copies)
MPMSGASVLGTRLRRSESGESSGGEHRARRTLAPVPFGGLDSVGAGNEGASRSSAQDTVRCPDAGGDDGMSVDFDSPIVQAGAVFAVVGGSLYVAALVANKSLGDVFLELGSACLTGGAIAVVVFLLQQAVNEDAVERENAAKEQRQFQTQLLMTANLRGFDPPPQDRGVSNVGRAQCPKDPIQTRLKGAYFASKTLDGARFDGLDLRNTNFRGASLVGATFRCAVLEGATLISANLRAADLSGARLDGADLRGASLQDAVIAAVKRRRWDGVKVNTRTCWPAGFLTAYADVRSALRVWAVRSSRPNLTDLRETYGHICGEDEVITTAGDLVPEPHSDIPRAQGEQDRSP